MDSIYTWLVGKAAEANLADWIIASFTAVLGVATILLWLATQGLLRAALAQSDDVRAAISAMRASATASQASAEAAIRANQLATENLVEENRAWLHVSDIELQGGVVGHDGSLVLHVRYTVRNAGRSPAVAVQIGSEPLMNLKDHDAEEAFVKSILAADAELIDRGILSDAIFPGAERTMVAAIFVSDATERSPRTGESTSVTFIIHISYKIMGDAIIRTTVSTWSATLIWKRDRTADPRSWLMPFSTHAS